MVSHKPSKAAAFAVLIWLTGFVWGTFVFMTPSLKATPPIPYVSSNPWISFPILIAWLPLTWWLARVYLRTSPDPRGDGRWLGVIFAGVNVMLDLVVLVAMFGAGVGYFASLTVLGAYALLFLIPRSVVAMQARARV